MANASRLEYGMAVCVVVESAVLYVALTRDVDAIAYLLPALIALVATVVTVAAFRDFVGSVIRRRQKSCV